jgi:Secretory lipase
MFLRPSLCEGFRHFPSVVLAAIVICALMPPPLAVAPVSAQSQPAAPARRAERLRTLPLTKFYDTPNPLPPGKPGELIRSERSDDYDLSADFSAVRILYHSRSASRGEVAASGVVLVPDGTAPAGGWPVIAWAHGFSAAARQCAPSLLRNLYYGPLLSMYVNLGYAVVATDYTGLGTDFRSAVMDVQSNAMDVIYSIPAAHAAVPQLGPKWVAMGSSLGANVAIGVAEMEGRTRDPNYLGSIAISGVADLKAAYEPQANEQSFRMLALLAYGIKTVYPDFDIRDMLTEKAIPVYRQVNGCSSLPNSSQFPASAMLKQNWRNDKFVEEFFSRNRLGQKPAYGPLLVISDDRDPEVPPSMTVQVVTRMCKQGDRIQFDKFSDPQPGLIIGDSVRDQMVWLEARFAGRPASNNCP